MMMKLLLLAAVLGMATAAPTNDVTLFIRALFQDCPDENQDYLAPLFLTGGEHIVTTHKKSRDIARASLSDVSAHNVVYFSSRTNFIDAKLEKWMAEEGMEQVVIVAAGFDSRAYRIPFADGKYFELDFPAVVADKEAKVIKLGLKTKGKSVSYVGADLRITTAAEALKATAGFDATKKTVYIVEGLVYYLHQPAVDTLFASLGSVASKGSRLIFDYTNECLVKEECADLNKAAIAIFLEIMHLKKEPWFSGMNRDAMGTWLATNGFKLDENLSFQDAKINPELNVTTWTNSTIMGQMNFATATKM